MGTGQCRKHSSDEMVLGLVLMEPTVQRTAEPGMIRARVGEAQRGQGWEVGSPRGYGSPESEQESDTPEGMGI